MIKAVLFDLGGTLIRGSDPLDLYEAYGKFLKAYGVSRSLSDIERSFLDVYRKPIIEKILSHGRSFWVEFNLLFLRKLGVRRNVHDLARLLDEEWWNHVEVSLYPDVLPLLDELKLRRLKLGVVTNGVESDIDVILKKVGLETFFELRVGIDTFGKVKPDRLVFEGCVERLKIPPSEILFVGDSIENDYFGACDVGMNAVLVDRGNKFKGEGLRKVRDLREVLSYL